MAKAATKKSRAVKQRRNSAKRTRGKPFEKGNPHAWKPGQSGNPTGRPKSVTLSEACRKSLASPVPRDPQGRTYAEVIADKMVAAAARGSINAAKELADRTEGRPRQALDVDLSAMDWRAMAQAFGLSFDDVIDEAKRLIESATAAGNAESDDQEAGR
jgi:hypothetical protein